MTKLLDTSGKVLELGDYPLSICLVLLVHLPLKNTQQRSLSVDEEYTFLNFPLKALFNSI